MSSAYEYLFTQEENKVLNDMHMLREKTLQDMWDIIRATAGKLDDISCDTGDAFNAAHRRADKKNSEQDE